MDNQSYRSGQWLSLNRVLEYLNTLEDNIVNKKDIYKHIHEMRPIDWIDNDNTKDFQSSE